MKSVRNKNNLGKVDGFQFNFHGQEGEGGGGICCRDLISRCLPPLFGTVVYARDLVSSTSTHVRIISYTTGTRTFSEDF